MRARTHYVKQHCRFHERDTGIDREEDALVDQLVWPIATVMGKAHIGSLLQALVGEPEATAAALTTKIHQKDDAGCSDGRMRIQSRGDDNTGGLMARCYRGASQELA